MLEWPRQPSFPHLSDFTPLSSLSFSSPDSRSALGFYSSFSSLPESPSPSAPDLTSGPPLSHAHTADRAAPAAVSVRRLRVLLSLSRTLGAAVSLVLRVPMADVRFMKWFSLPIGDPVEPVGDTYYVVEEWYEVHRIRVLVSAQLCLVFWLVRCYQSPKNQWLNYLLETY